MPTQSKFTILKQVMEQIPAYLISKVARKHGVDQQSRTFTPASHVSALVYAQLSHALSLNDVCDSLRHHSGALATVHGAQPPSRNGLSHANRVRNADMAEELFWETLTSLQQRAPKFGMGRNYCGFPHRFKRVINVVDSTTIRLVAHCMDWARHRRRKAAAKCHMRLDLQTFLPRFALVKSAKSHDAAQAVPLCATMRAGEIAVFDKAYVDFAHLYHLHQRGIFWVTRSKDNMVYTIIKKRKCAGPVRLDAEIRLENYQAAKDYPETFRLVIATVEIDGKDMEMSFISNHREWSAGSICDLYKGRWGVEVFFKQLKQTLQLADFLGYNENAVRWQIWTALLTYVVLRFISYLSRWKGSFGRLFTAIRGVLWNRFELYALLKQCCGTAKSPPRMLARPDQLYIPGFAV